MSKKDNFFHAKLQFLRGWVVFLSKKNDMCAFTSSLESRLKELETEAEVVAAKSMEEKRFEKRWRSTNRRSLRERVKRAGRQRAREARISRP